MENIQHHPQLAEFIRSLERLEKVLRENGAEFWAARITRVKEIANNSDGYCLEMFLGCFGGMGSLNDPVLNAPASANEVLHQELGHSRDLARALK